MAWIRAYRWEDETYQPFNEIKLADKEVAKYLKKLCRHFKTLGLLVKVSSYERGGVYFHGFYRHTKGRKRKGANFYGTGKPNEVYGGMVRIERNPSLGLVIHEFAHHLTAKKFGTGEHHGKKFKRCLKMCYTFSRRWLKQKQNPLNDSVSVN